MLYVYSDYFMFVELTRKKNLINSAVIGGSVGASVAVTVTLIAIVVYIVIRRKR